MDLEFKNQATRPDLLERAMEETFATEGQTIFSLKDSIGARYEKICSMTLGEDFAPWITPGQLTPEQARRREEFFRSVGVGKYKRQ